MTERWQHPGHYLRLLLDDTQVGQRELANHLKVSPAMISHLITGLRGVSVSMAVKLGRFFHMPPRVWLQYQLNWELQQLEQDQRFQRTLQRIPPLDTRRLPPQLQARLKETR